MNKRTIFLICLSILAIIMVFHASYYFTNSWNVTEFVGLKTTPFKHIKGSLYRDDLWLTLFLIHITTGSIGILTALPQFIPKLREKSPQTHKRLGKLYISTVLVSSFIALYLSFYVEVTPVVSWQFYVGKIGFLMGSVGWFITSLFAFNHARKGRIESHKNWAIRSYAFTFTVVSFRVFYQIFYNVVELEFTDAYLLGILFSWPVTWSVGEALIWRRKILVVEEGFEVELG